MNSRLLLILIVLRIGAQSLTLQCIQTVLHQAFSYIQDIWRNIWQNGIMNAILQHYPFKNNQVQHVLVLKKTKSFRLKDLLPTVYENIVGLLELTKYKADPQLLWI